MQSLGLVCGYTQTTVMLHSCSNIGNQWLHVSKAHMDYKPLVCGYEYTVMSFLAFLSLYHEKIYMYAYMPTCHIISVGENISTPLVNH
jgi:hypothetical protein